MACLHVTNFIEADMIMHWIASRSGMMPVSKADSGSDARNALADESASTIQSRILRRSRALSKTPHSHSHHR
jgi:hypothetical protein